MKLPQKMQARKEVDRALEKSLNIRKYDPTREKFGGKLYSTDDIRRLEEEKVPWLRERRARQS